MLEANPIAIPNLVEADVGPPNDPQPGDGAGETLATEKEEHARRETELLQANGRLEEELRSIRMNEGTLTAALRAAKKATTEQHIRAQVAEQYAHDLAGQVTELGELNHALHEQNQALQAQLAVIMRRPPTNPAAAFAGGAVAGGLVTALVSALMSSDDDDAD